MQKLKSFFRHLCFRLKHDYLSFDNVTFVIAIAMCFLWTCSSITAMSRNWELSQKIAEKKSEQELLSLEVNTLEYENEYYASVEYQELSARAKQNKKLPGENLVYLPENSQEAKTKYDIKSEEIVVEEPSNFSQWMSFLFGI